MKSNETIKTLLGGVAVVLLFVLSMYVLSGFGTRERLADEGVRNQILYLANGTEPEEIDPHVSTGVQEDNIIRALIEGLVSEAPEDLQPVPGMAERWDISEDGRIYTFHLREAQWSNGDPVTAQDFVLSYQRALTPSLACEYAYMLYYMVNAEAFNQGRITDFSEVGAQALDPRTLRITLNHPTPFFLSLLNHYSWFPVHVASIRKHGGFAERQNQWTRPENFVGNGPFLLEDWQVNNVLIVRKNPAYWDADRVRLRKIYFYPIESLDTEERAFRAGQVHKTNKLPLPAIPAYLERDAPELFNAPYLGTYFYMLNTTLPALRDKRVRQALNLSIDRRSIVENVTRGGEMPAFHFVPPNCAGYNSRHQLDFNIPQAQQLLAEAGYPGGRGFPTFSLLYNTLESHKTIAEAVQQMWKENLGINIQLENQEWKVYLNSKTSMDFEMVRFGWIGDYVDPNTFMDLWIKESGNNNSGWSSPEYDRLIAEAGRATDREQRFEYFQQAEKILLEDVPIVPIYFYTSIYLLDPRVKNWYPTLIDHHPYKYVYLEESSEASSAPAALSRLRLPFVNSLSRSMAP